jgi:putative spermidine/putrescine transport system ATP-binding protein
VPERTFFRDPYTIGDVVLAAWPTDLGRVLAKPNLISA